MVLSATVDLVFPTPRPPTAPRSSRGSTPHRSSGRREGLPTQSGPSDVGVGWDPSWPVSPPDSFGPGRDGLGRLGGPGTFSGLDSGQRRTQSKSCIPRPNLVFSDSGTHSVVFSPSLGFDGAKV